MELEYEEPIRIGYKEFTDAISKLPNLTPYNWHHFRGHYKILVMDKFAVVDEGEDDYMTGHAIELEFEAFGKTFEPYWKPVNHILLVP